MEIEAETIREIWEYLKEKDDDTRKIFYLFYSLELTIPEIAGEMKRSESFVKNRLYRTVKEIRERYRDGS